MKEKEPKYQLLYLQGDLHRTYRRNIYLFGPFKVEVFKGREQWGLDIAVYSPEGELIADWLNPEEYEGDFLRKKVCQKLHEKGWKVYREGEQQ